VGPERDAGGDDDLHRPDGSRPLTDLGNAERLVARHGRDIHYCHAWGRWLVWDRRRWRGDDTGAAERLAVRTVRSIYREAERAPTKEGSDAIAAHARRSESRQRIESMLALARSQPGVPVRPDDLDRDPWLLNVANGTIDLRTGELRKHRREDLATRLAPVDYDEQARAPLWDAFLARILPDGDVRAYMRRWMGYALTGVIREHVLVIAHGSGANAKTTFVDAGRRALGDYARTIPAEVLLARTHDAHPTERAQLLGVRLAITSESDQGRRLDEGTVKTLTGGDRITARFMRQDFFEFSPTHKLILMTNHKPRIRGTDVGIWRRIMLVPFPVVIPEAERDPALPERIATETPGILAWAVRGCLEWQARGLAPPAAVREATASYQRDEDTLGEYLAERTVADAAARTSAADLHRDYVAWAERAGVRPAGQRDLAEALAARSYVRHTLHGRRVYRGVRLLATGDGVRVGDHLPYCPTRGENSQRTGTPSPTLTLAGRDDEGEGWPS
jgi:putative DNA primase/helicase